MTALILVCIVGTGAAAFGVAIWVGADHDRGAPPKGLGASTTPRRIF